MYNSSLVRLYNRDDDGKFLLETEISDTQVLKWWLSGYGSSDEVIEPIDLRKYFESEADLLGNLYNRNKKSKRKQINGLTIKR